MSRNIASQETDYHLEEFPVEHHLEKIMPYLKEALILLKSCSLVG